MTGMYKHTMNQLLFASVLEEVRMMNVTMKLEVNTVPTNLGKERLLKFIEIAKAELNEASEVLAAFETSEEDGMVALADWIGDNIVYHVSESIRWGIPIGCVLTDIMNSQESKLLNGEPVPDPNIPGKFGKGPNYVPPEETIRTTLAIFRGKAESKEIDDGVTYE